MMSNTTSLDRFVRVFRTAYPHFSRLDETSLSHIRTLYPKTSHSLMRLATHIVQEKYGNELLDRYRRFSAEETQLDFNAIREFVALEAKKLPPEAAAEILQESFVPSKEITQGLLQLFEKSMENLINLSHLTIQMLLAENMYEQALDCAFKINPPVERSKAFLELIHHDIRHNHIETAEKLYPHILSTQEKRSAATTLVNAWLHKDMVEDAIIFSGNIEEESERNHALQEAALCMVKQGKIDEAISLIDCFEDPDAKAYGFSRLVNNLATVGDFKNALLITQSIVDNNYKQDAFTYILNKQISMRRIEEATEIASLISDIKGRQAATKMIERALLSHQQDKKIKQLDFRSRINH